MPKNLSVARSLYVKSLVAGGLSLAAATSFATGLDMSALTGAVDVSTVVTAMVAMGALLILPNVAKWAVKKVASFF